MQVISNWADIEAHYLPLTEAEEQLKAACQTGGPCTLGDGELPEAETPPSSREIRAPILRYFILGGCESCPVTSKGVDLEGAYVTGQLDIGFEHAKGKTYLFKCRFEEGIRARQAQLDFLLMNGSHFPGLHLENARVAGHVLLRDTEATGEVRLYGTKIDGQLEADRAAFINPDGVALNLQGARISGDVYLRNLTFKGLVHMPGCHIVGNLEFGGSHLTPLEDEAMRADNITVGGAFHWTDVNCPAGNIRLSSSHVFGLADDLQSWPGNERLFLDGFTYDRIMGTSTHAEARIKWLKKGAYWAGEFYPQPFTQLAKVLRDMGHEADARKVLARREHLLRRHEREQRPFVTRPALAVWHWAQQTLVGYGHHPERSVYWLAGLWFVAVWICHFAWISGDFAPNSGVIQTSHEWRQVAAREDNPAAVWSARIRDADGQRTGYKPGQDWETFNRYAYAADLVIPIINLGQTDAWAPSTERSAWGRVLWTSSFFLHIAGWIVTALGAAAITGIIRRE